MIGIDPTSDGLARAERLGVPTSSHGIDGLLAMPGFGDIRLVFDATSAGAHARHWELLRHHGIRVVDLTPAAIGPFCVPVVNLNDHIDAPNLNMVTCGGQATVPIVAAVNESALVSYAEIVSSISSKSAGPGTRANIDEFIETTAAALKVVGGAQRSKAVIILNPADPPILMRNTVYCLVEGDCDHAAIDASITRMVDEVQRYVPGYQLQAARSVRDLRCRQPAAHTRNREIHRYESHRAAAGDRCRPLPAGIRRQPRHHDVRRAGHRRTHRRAFDDKCRSIAMTQP